MKRRAFLGFLGGAAASGPVLSKSIASDAVLKQSGFPAGNTIAGAAPMTPEAVSGGTVSKFVRWVRRSGIPSWKMQELKRQAEYSRQYGLDPDIAALVSVSGGWKAREQRRRNLERTIESSLASIGKQAARRDFDEKALAKFGQMIDWYE